MSMSAQKILASLGGDLWRSWHMVALWPYPAVLLGAHHVKTTADDYRCFTRLLRPGDLLLTRCEPYFLSNRFIGRNGTAFSHLAVYTGPVRGHRDQDTGFIMKPRAIDDWNRACTVPGEFKRTVTHAISEGVVCQDLLEILNHVDWMCAVRPWRRREQATTIQGVALRQIGLEYDFDFTPEGPKAFYCTGLGAQCVIEAGIEPPEQTEIKVSLLGKRAPVTLADAFLKKYLGVCCTLSCAEPWFLRQSRFDIREKLLDMPDASRFVKGV